MPRDENPKSLVPNFQNTQQAQTLQTPYINGKHIQLQPSSTIFY